MCKYIQIKNKEAPLVWTYRINQALSLVSIILVIAMNDNSILGLYLVARSSPDRIWIDKHINNSDPKFQNNEILFGVGRVTAVDLIILNIGLFLYVCVIINLGYEEVP